MVIHELTTTQCREMLGRAHHGRLGCAQDHQPYVVPIFFYLDPEESCLYSFSTVGQKIAWMRANPRVCVEIDEIVDQFRWTTVVVFGRYEELGDSARDSDARRRAFELFQQHSQWWLPGTGKVVLGEEHHTPVTYRIVIDGMTGRRAGGPPA
jgi:nitroimidazol reductase NimA-like FMN-containing flavoprotein (pyridoxamine 5'-phosphate oxidase superfamily)